MFATAMPLSFRETIINLMRHRPQDQSSTMRSGGGRSINAFGINLSPTSLVLGLTVSLLGASASAQIRVPAESNLPKPVPADGNEQEAASLDGLRVERFDVSEVMQRLSAETGLVGEEAENWLHQRIATCLDLEAEAGTTGSSMGVLFSEGFEHTLKLQEDGRACAVSGTELIIVGQADDVAMTRAALKTMKEFGIRQIIISTHVFRAPAEQLEKLPINWSFVDTLSSVAATVDPSQTAKSPKGPVTTATYHEFGRDAVTTGTSVMSRYRNDQKRSTELLRQQLERLAAPEGVTTSTWTVASSIIERSTPVLYTLLNPKECGTAIEQARENPNVERVMSPTVVVFNGQIADVQDLVERPFVTGVKPVRVGSEGNEQIQLTPSIRVYPEGTKMTLRPQLSGGTKIRLNCDLEMCKIQKVDALSIPRTDVRAEFTVQMPQVASTQFNTCIDLPVGHALAFTTTETETDGSRVSTLFVCKCTVRDLDPAATGR